MTRRQRPARTQRAVAISKWRRNKQAAGDWEERCMMRFPDGTRCRNTAAGRFGYCEPCWKSSN